MPFFTARGLHSALLSILINALKDTSHYASDRILFMISSILIFHRFALLAVAAAQLDNVRNHIRVNLN